MSSRPDYVREQLFAGSSEELFVVWPQLFADLMSSRQSGSNSQPIQATQHDVVPQLAFKQEVAEFKFRRHRRMNRLVPKDVVFSFGDVALACWTDGRVSCRVKRRHSVAAHDVLNDGSHVPMAVDHEDDRKAMLERSLSRFVRATIDARYMYRLRP